jgi:hypothetical protein
METKIIAAVASFVKSTPSSERRFRKSKTARKKEIVRGDEL